MPAPVAQATSHSSQTGTSSVSGNSNSNVSRNGQIALEVVLPLGAIAVAILAWFYTKPWKKSKGEGESGERHEFHEMGV